MSNYRDLLDEIADAIRKQTELNLGTLNAINVQENSNEIHLEWVQPSKECRDVFIRLIDEPPVANALVAIVQSRFKVPQALYRNVSVLMNILNMNSDYGSFRLNHKTGLLSFVASGFHKGCDTKAMAVRFIKEADCNLNKVVDLCLLSVKSNS